MFVANYHGWAPAMNLNLVKDHEAMHIIDYDCLLVISVINLPTSISKLTNVDTNLLLVDFFFFFLNNSSWQCDFYA